MEYKFSDDFQYKYTVDDNGKFHSYNDMPAIDFLHYNMKIWYEHGLRHRLEIYGPALISDNVIEYYNKDKLHREMGDARITGKFKIDEKFSCEDNIINGRYELHVVNKNNGKVVYGMAGFKNNNKKQGVWRFFIDRPISNLGCHYQMVFDEDKLTFVPNIILLDNKLTFDGEINTYKFFEFDPSPEVILVSKKQYKNGCLNGSTWKYNFKGERNCIQTYKNNKLNGTTIYLEKNCSKVNKVEEYNNGKCELSFSFDENDNLII